MAYRTHEKIIVEIERLFGLYEREVEERKREGCLKPSAADTYLTHTRHFIRWCKGEFIPGGKKLQKKTKPY